MLTVKIIRPDRSEYVMEATCVFLNTAEQSPSENEYITFFTDGKANDVFEGLVYVMNNNGKTVADYVLAPIKDLEK